ncbi:sigma-70 family RNA polymerase sigma factor [Pseudoalteromonas sp. XMcav1-K]|uniref:sigma-70 family RNA polymerase sigma factor n=1 Tax=Pseudoalteromonas sp. XMcav1-K TaxID=3374372 RepID=UPI00375715D9
MLLTLTTWLSADLSAEEIMVRYRDSGKKRYLNQLVNAYYDDLYHFLVSQSDQVLAQDISQKTWLKVIEKKALFKTSVSFKSWLFMIARRLLIDEFRSQNKLTQLDDVQLVCGQSQEVSGDDMLAVLDSALNALNFYQREAFILQKEGFSVDEIAHITGCEFETIKSRLRYAKQNLRNMLKGYADE